MKHSSSALLFMAGLLVCVFSTHAEPLREGSGFYLPFLVGGEDFSSDKNLDDSFVFSVGAGYAFNDKLSLEGLYGESEAEFEADPTQDTNVDFFHFSLLYHPLIVGKWRPYLATGFGQADFAAGVPNPGEQAQWNFGLGAKRFLSEHFDLRADFRNFLGFEDDDIDVQFQFGIDYYPFARKVATVQLPKDSDGDGVFDRDDRCPGTPIGTLVDSRGCPLATDADGDGVEDQQDRCPNTPKGVQVDSRGCPLDSDGDGVYDYLDACPDTPKGAVVDAKGCRLQLKETVSIELQVNFDTDSAQVKPLYRSEIAKVAEFMRQYPDTTVVIEGHTDSRGAASYNKDLSQRRADSVRLYLIQEFGVSGERLSAVGYGEERPIADNTTAAGLQANRRVVAVISAEVLREQ